MKLTMTSDYTPYSLLSFKLQEIVEFPSSNTYNVLLQKYS